VITCVSFVIISNRQYRVHRWEFVKQPIFHTKARSMRDLRWFHVGRHIFITIASMNLHETSAMLFSFLLVYHCSHCSIVRAPCNPRLKHAVCDSKQHASRSFGNRINRNFANFAVWNSMDRHLRHFSWNRIE